MPHCPKCNAELGQTAVRCEACGYDFPETPPSDQGRREGFAYSPLADIAIIVGGIAAGLGCAGAVVSGLIAVDEGKWMQVLFYSPVTFLLCFAMLVVFLRVQER